MELDCQEYQECPGLDLIALDSAAWVMIFCKFTRQADSSLWRRPFLQGISPEFTRTGRLRIYFTWCSNTSNILKMWGHNALVPASFTLTFASALGLREPFRSHWHDSARSTRFLCTLYVGSCFQKHPTTNICAKQTKVGQCMLGTKQECQLLELQTLLPPCKTRHFARTALWPTVFCFLNLKSIWLQRRAKHSEGSKRPPIQDLGQANVWRQAMPLRPMQLLDQRAAQHEQRLFLQPPKFLQWRWIVPIQYMLDTI